jgi:CheY-like chemotaxis protein
VVEAANGPAALAILGESGDGIEAMIVDFAMPGMNGIELARQARRRIPGLPAVLVTGYADSAALAGSGEAGEVLQKPFRRADLAAKLALALDRRT